jgi:hypothetical protein
MAFRTRTATLIEDITVPEHHSQTASTDKFYTVPRGIYPTPLVSVVDVGYARK